jgi:hypothetical protein
MKWRADTSRKEAERYPCPHAMATFCTLIAAALWTSLPGSFATNISVAEREPALVVVVAPSGSLSSLGSSEAMRSLSAVLVEATDFDPHSPERAGIDQERFSACGRDQRFGCWVRTIREARVRFRSTFLVSLAPISAGRDQVSVLLFDLEAAGAAQDRMGEGQELEGALFALAIRAGPEQVSNDDPQALDAVFTRFVRGPFREQLDRDGHLDPFGELELARAEYGATFALDGKQLGTITSSSAIVRDVRPGPHTIDVGPYRCKTEVKRGLRAVVSVPACENVADELGAWRTPQTIAGASIAGIGAAMLVFAIAKAGSGPATVCLTKDPAAADRCESLGNTSFAYSTDQLPARDLDSVEGGLIKPGPLGVGLIAAGGILLAGSRWLDDESWWLPIVLAIGAGVAGYSVTAIAGH